MRIAVLIEMAVPVGNAACLEIAVHTSFALHLGIVVHGDILLCVEV